MKQNGFSFIELLVVISIAGILASITLAAFVSSRKGEALKNDTEAVIAVLHEARNQTISSKNASAYGVHFATSSVTLFVGTTYSPSTTTNQVTTLTSGTTLSTTLPVGTTALVFNRITGETDQSGMVMITLLSSTSSTTIRVYKTGTIERVTQ